MRIVRKKFFLCSILQFLGNDDYLITFIKKNYYSLIILSLKVRHVYGKGYRNEIRLMKCVVFFYFNEMSIRQCKFIKKKSPINYSNDTFFSFFYSIGC